MTQQNLTDFDSLWDYSNPGGTETKFREALKQIPKNESSYLELLTQIARAQGLQRKFNEAHETLDQVEETLDKKSSRAKVRYLLERGRVFNSSSQPDQAHPFFERALDMAKELDEDFYAVDSIHMLAIIASPATSLDLNLQAIKLAESSDQPKARTWLGSLYNNMGWTYHDMGNFQSALKMFESAESFRREYGTVERRRIATWCLARTLRSLNRIDEALSKQIALKAELDSDGASDGYVSEEIGECLLLLNREDEAHPHFAKAYEVLSQDEFLVEQEPDRIARLKKLGLSSP